MLIQQLNISTCFTFFVLEQIMVMSKAMLLLYKMNIMYSYNYYVIYNYTSRIFSTKIDNKWYRSSRY